MFNRRSILSLATLVVGASAGGIFRQFGDKVSQQSNPCHITCPREYAPVCATDAETYENICLFGIAKCMNKDLQLVANVTCPDLLIHLTYLAQKSMIESFNAVDSTYKAVGNLTKGTAEMISSTLESVPIITLPNFNLPIFGIPPVLPQILKTSSTTTTTTTTTATSTSTSTSATTINTTTSATTINTTTTAAAKSIAREPSAAARRLIEIPSLEQGASGVIAQVTKTIQSALSGSGISGTTPSALGLNNLEDARTTVEGMVRTIPYAPGRNSSGLLMDGVSQIVKLPSGMDGKNLLANITSPDLLGLQNITSGSLGEIAEKISSRNITLNNENMVPGSSLGSIKNMTALTTSSPLSSENNITSSGALIAANSTLNKLISGKFNTTEIFRGIGSAINNISKNIKDQVDNEIENLN